MTLYRAEYVTKGGTVRRMTLAADSIKAAHETAAQWVIDGETLHDVSIIRELARPKLVQPHLPGF